MSAYTSPQPSTLPSRPVGSTNTPRKNSPSSPYASSSTSIPRRPSPNKPIYPSSKSATPPPLGSSWRQPAAPQVLYELPISLSRHASAGTSETLQPPSPEPGNARTNARGRATPPPPPSSQSYKNRKQNSQSPSAGRKLGGSSINGSGSGSNTPVPMTQREGSLFSNGDAGRTGTGMGAASTYSKRGQDRISSPRPQDLDLFAHHCQLFYFSPTPPDSSATYISKTLASLPPSHRATFTRIQASLRAQSHDHAARLRLTHFHALISSTLPTASLSPLARGDLRGKRAKKERRERLGRFVEQWCSPSGVGVEPFFKGLYNGLKLQGKGERAVGGAGGRTVVWEMDDAVFMEAGGKEFMNEAITMFKGVLGLEDVALSKPPQLRRPSFRMNPSSSNLLLSPSPIPDTAIEQLASPVSGAGIAAPPPLPVRKPSITQVEKSNMENGLNGNRLRAGSDPFTDPRRSPAKDKSKSPLGRRGPAPVPPPSRSYHSPQPLHVSTAAALNITTGLAPSAVSPASEILNPLSPSAETPLLPPPGGEVRLNETAISNLEEAAAREMDDGGPGRYRADSDLTSESEDQRTLMPRRSRDLLRPSAFEELDEDEDDLTAPRLRLWTFPAYISDPEISSLLSLFPTHIATSSTTAVRFPLPRPASLIGTRPSLSDIEAGVSPSRMTEMEWPFQLGIRVPPQGCDGFIRPGTGRMWVGEGIREPGWQGGFWFRVGRWFAKLFGR